MIINIIINIIILETAHLFKREKFFSRFLRLQKIDGRAEPGLRRAVRQKHQVFGPDQKTKLEVDALGVITLSRRCFERCCSYRKTTLYHPNLRFATLRTLRCSVRPHTVHRPARVGFFGFDEPVCWKGESVWRREVGFGTLSAPRRTAKASNVQPWEKKMGCEFVCYKGFIKKTKTIKRKLKLGLIRALMNQFAWQENIPRVWHRNSFCAARHTVRQEPQMLGPDQKKGSVFVVWVVWYEEYTKK